MAKNLLTVYRGDATLKEVEQVLRQLVGVVGMSIEEGRTNTFLCLSHQERFVEYLGDGGPVIRLIEQVGDALKPMGAYIIQSRFLIDEVGKLQKRKT